MVRLMLPTGSLESPVLQLMLEAGLAVTRTSRSNSGSVADPRIGEARFLRPQHIPRSVARDRLTVGICGEDSVRESGQDVATVTRLALSKNTAGPVRVVLFGAADNPCRSIADVPEGSTVSTEYPNLTADIFRRLGKKVEIEFSYGSTEAEIPSEFDFGVTVVETGTSLAANGLKIVEVLMESSTVIVCNRQAAGDPEAMRAFREIALLLQGVLTARSKVLLSMNVMEARLPMVLKTLPSMRQPTVGRLSSPEYLAVSAVVPRDGLPLLVTQLLQAGAEDLVETPVAKAIRGW